jgi:hypothetical protein
MLNVHNFPQSDALRVEMTCDHDKYVAFGHRNGQVSLIDLRASQTVCSIYQCEQPPPSSSSSTARNGKSINSPPLLGSVSDLSFLSSTFDTKQMIVRRSFGSCQVHDIRKLSSSSATTTNYHHNVSSPSTTVVHNLMVPSDDINPTLSSNCNGFVVDPIGHQTLISPYINTNCDACLGIWSLQTGLMVGSRLLQSCSSSPSSNATGRDILYVELCRRTTPSFSSAPNKEKVVSSSSFAAWLKCGAFTKDKVSSKVGSLHQISFPGHWQ